MPATRFLEHGSSNDGADPVSICIRAPGKTPQEAVDWAKRAVQPGYAVIEEEDDGVFCVTIADHPELGYINLWVNLNNVTEAMDNPDDADEY